MAETPDPDQYTVSYSEKVQAELRTLLLRARGRGLGEEVLDAVKELDRRLKIYPQFGQPLRNLNLEPAQLWIGVVEPLVAQYFLDEDRRLVIVSLPISVLPNTGLDP
jgi:hypothetical protein